MELQPTRKARLAGVTEWYELVKQFMYSVIPANRLSPGQFFFEDLLLIKTESATGSDEDTHPHPQFTCHHLSRSTPTPTQNTRTPFITRTFAVAVDRPV